MTIWKQALDFYINSSVHVALAVCSMVLVTYLHFDVEVDWTLMWFVFFASITAYNFVKYFGIAKFHHRRLATWLKIIQVFSFFCFVALCFFTFQLSWVTIGYLAIFGVITFFYAIPFFPKRYYVDPQQNLRNIGGVKVYIIAFVWSGVTVLLPLLNDQIPLTFDVYVEGVQRFLLVMALMIPFEIRDLQYDSLRLSTIPQQIGIRNSKLLGAGLMLVYFLGEFIKTGTTQWMVVDSLWISFLTVALIYFAKKEQNYYSSFWVEGVPIFWVLFLLVLKFFFKM